MGPSKADTFLKMALVHWPVAHGQGEANRREILRLNRRAAQLGARVIVNTEMALSGYGYDSRQEIAPVLESADGQTIEELAALAREFGLYLALGMAERDSLTEAYHNSAVLLGPDGRIKARRRKVTAEAKWACPGTAIQNDCCDTPFGRVGLLICSETYFSLLPRTMALKGVDLLLVPANWPPGPWNQAVSGAAAPAKTACTWPCATAREGTSSWIAPRPVRMSSIPGEAICCPLSRWSPGYTWPICR